MVAQLETYKQSQVSSQVAFRDFVTGLHVMSTRFDALVQNFAWCAGRIAGNPSAPAQLRGMMDFAQAYHQFGLEIAMKAIEKNSGVPVEVITPDVQNGITVTTESPHQAGLIVGLVGAEYTKDRIMVFDGVAMIADRRGREIFVPVYIQPNGLTILHPGYVLRPNETRIEQLYPPTQKRNKRKIIHRK